MIYKRRIVVLRLTLYGYLYAWISVYMSTHEVNVGVFRKKLFR